jgi:hypothetical protein
MRALSPGHGAAETRSALQRLRRASLHPKHQSRHTDTRSETERPRSTHRPEHRLPTTYEVLIQLPGAPAKATPAQVLEAVADAVRHGSGFHEVAINVYVPALEEYQVEVVMGSSEAQAALTGARIPAE